MQRVSICPSAALQNGGAGVRFQVERPGGRAEAFAIRFAGKVYAYLNSCRHVPIELDWNPGEFFDLSRLYLICSTHGALYEPETGVCVGGPCRGARLQPVPVEESGGQVWMSVQCNE